MKEFITILIHHRIGEIYKKTKSICQPDAFLLYNKFMFKFRFLTSGESHGKCLNAIIEGVPAGIRIKNDLINKDLARRQSGYGRGARMKIETDTIEIKSGVRFGKTTGAPICLEIQNKDYINWADVMSTAGYEYQTEDIIRKIEEKSSYC